MCRFEKKWSQQCKIVSLFNLLLCYLLRYKNRSTIYQPYLWVVDAYVCKDTRVSIYNYCSSLANWLIRFILCNTFSFHAFFTLLSTSKSFLAAKKYNRQKPPLFLHYTFSTFFLYFFRSVCMFCNILMLLTILLCSLEYTCKCIGQNAVVID